MVLFYFLFCNILDRLTALVAQQGVKWKGLKILHFGDKIGSAIIVILIPPDQFPGTYFRNCLSLITPIPRGDRNLIGNDLKRVDQFFFSLDVYEY